jgi:Family of unknown function (DUF6461)
VDDLVQAQALCDRLGESYHLLYVKGPDGWSVSRSATAPAETAAAEASAPAGEAVAVSRSAGSARFEYAVSGETVTAFDPGYPAEETMWGADPGRLSHLMNALGLRPPMYEYEDEWKDSDARAIVLAQRITGLRPASLFT